MTRYEVLRYPDRHRGVIHAGGTPWHRDACAPAGMSSMRAAIYLNPLGPDDGCLSVVPGR
ncbi:MAG: hypothetical protein OXJ90_09760 [Spirochaetaceae bacterium]|nr:hypothetical protein [Spirochaetaceae bacterium]